MPNAIHLTLHDTDVANGRKAVGVPPPRTTAPGQRRRSSHRLRRILVATDGTHASEGAMMVAGLLAHRDGSLVDVASVLRRWGHPPPTSEFLEITGELLGERLARIVPQSQRALGGVARVRTISVVDSSSIVQSLADTARSGKYDLIVMGVRRGRLGRWFQRPTALAVAERSGVPVLAVPHSVSSLPARAVVGVNGTDADLSVVTAAARALSEPADVDLVHVQRAGAGSSAGWAPRFARVERALDGSNLGTVERVVLHEGEPAARLVAHARRTGTDLIAVGIRRPGTLAARVRGGVGRRLLRATDCCVLLCAQEPADSTTTATRKQDEDARSSRGLSLA